MKTKLILIPLIALTGCVLVPRTKIQGDIAGKPFKLECPKDLDADSIVAKVETNGTASVEIRGIHTRMNPEVITTTGDAQVKMIDHMFQGAQGLIQAAPK